MARAGMARWRGRNASNTEGGDDVQKSLELLDKVLSEFDDIENGNMDGEAAPVASTSTSATPDDDSPSLGHQSEDDGYMSMNGRRAKFVLSFKPVPDEGQDNELPPAPDPPPEPPPQEMADFPPPPEEAQRIISTLLPRVSTGNGVRKSKPCRHAKGILSSMTLGTDIIRAPPVDRSATTATQTTLPKTRHQRPYGWETGTNQEPFLLQDQLGKFGSLPYDGCIQHNKFPPPWLMRQGPLPPRTVPGVIDRHREVRRRISGEDEEDSLTPPLLRTLTETTDDNFSDDSLEESLPPPPPPANKRGSIAWEVPLDEEDPLYTPGSTKVIGRRRRKSTEHSSNSSIHRLRDSDEWPEPPLSTEDEAVSPYSDSIYDSNDPEETVLPPALPLDLTFNGTYVIRKGKKKDRKQLPLPVDLPPSKPVRPRYDRQSSLDAPRKSSKDLKRSSSTFDNIRMLIREGKLDGMDDAPPDFHPPNPPNLVRVVSLPSFPTEEQDVVEHRNSKTERFPHDLPITVEEAEDELSSLDTPSLTQIQCEVHNPKKQSKPIQCNGKTQGKLQKCNTIETQTDLSDFEGQNELESVSKQIREISRTKAELDEVEKKIQEIVKIKTVVEMQAREEELSDPWIHADDLKPVPVLEDSKTPDEFKVKVEVVTHEFGPLPPSPVEEDDEYSEIFHLSQTQTPRGKADTLPEPFYRCQEPEPGSDPSGKYLIRPPEPPPPHIHRTSEPITNSLKTRSMDAGFRGAPRSYCNGPRREGGVERRTLPSELPGPASRRRTFQKRCSASTQDSLQTSCSLPETPIFARGCDIPRTPHRRAPEPPPQQRSSGIQNSTYRRNGTGSECGTVGTGATGLNHAMVGAEILRLAGGPQRGWYPRHRQTRPASIEHLDRITSGPWEMTNSRKPMTLPPNITPKFFHRSPRDALRRVTSLLIRGKGTNTKEQKKDVLSPTNQGLGELAGETSRQKKGFFKNFWKRSRHYSLDQQ